MGGHQARQLVKMANQIAANLGGERDPQQAALRCADHLRRFWTRDMLQELVAHARTSGDDLSPPVISALSQLIEK